MMTISHVPSSDCLEAELEWFSGMLEAKVELRFPVTGKKSSPPMPPKMPNLDDYGGPYARFVKDLELSPEARLVLVLALLPVLRPSALDILKAGEMANVSVTDFGGYSLQVHKGFIPTIETALFLIAGSDYQQRIGLLQFFHTSTPLFRHHWLKIEQLGIHEPFTASLLLASRDVIDLVTRGKLSEPEFGSSFPAERIETFRSWDELVLSAETSAEIQDILHWITHEDHVMRKMRLHEKVSPGFRCLFHGAPGTGKSFTASLLGKATGRDVYRIDLSMVVSKYIGETEKNLKVIFDKAESRGWILFFDEADALFGKRTDVSDSKDRYANQEVSYLLQRVENFNGIVILATNNRDNMDKAFTRRFQSIVNFTIPKAEERLRLWEKSLPETFRLAKGVNLASIADRFEISGGNIVNIIRHCALRATVRGKPVIEEIDILDGLQKEYRKAGRLMN
jgi:ATPase family associated with various cellular activities (AAA)